MKSLLLGSFVSFDTLTNACAKHQAVFVPVVYDGNKKSFEGIILDAVMPLGIKEDGAAIFKGKTFQTNGEDSIMIDGATWPQKKEGGSYGYLNIY